MPAVDPPRLVIDGAVLGVRDRYRRGHTLTVAVCRLHAALTWRRRCYAMVLAAHARATRDAFTATRTGHPDDIQAAEDSLHDLYEAIALWKRSRSGGP